MILLRVGLTHSTAPLEVRESLAITPERLPAALAALKGYVSAGVILSTCNRTEVYAIAGHEKSGARRVTNFLADYQGRSVESLSPYLQVYSQRKAVRHLFRVASGLDSMIVGEEQILGQVREAHQASLDLKLPGPILTRLFSHAVALGKRVRSQTALGRNGGSVSWAAVQYAKGTIPATGEGRVLIVGAGQTGRLTGRALARELPCHILVASRTYQSAQRLAREVGGRAVPFEALPEALASVDVAISSTDSPGFILETPAVEQAMAVRAERPLLLIDIALPRDIHPDAARVANVSLRHLDELKEVGDLYRQGNEAEVARVEEMAEAEADRFMAWWASREVVPTIKALRAKAEGIRRRELEKALRRFDGLSAEERGRLEALTSAIVNKLLHHPVVRLKSGEDAHSYVRVLKELFQLSDVEAADQSGPG